jgi:hypothetical protein
VHTEMGSSYVEAVLAGLLQHLHVAGAMTGWLMCMSCLPPQHTLTLLTAVSTNCVRC